MILDCFYIISYSVFAFALAGGGPTGLDSQPWEERNAPMVKPNLLQSRFDYEFTVNPLARPRDQEFQKVPRPNMLYAMRVFILLSDAMMERYKGEAPNRMELDN